MARVNVYLPDELAQQARDAGLSVSAVTQEALRSVLERRDVDLWVDRLDNLPAANVSHQGVMQALDEARAEFGA